MTTAPAPDEFDLIARLFAPLAAGHAGALGLKDDAALADVTPGKRLVITCDAIVEGVHYLVDELPEVVARKLVRVNLSDIAAMGARPVAILLAAAFSKAATADWIERFAAGLAADVAEFGIPLIGGDTVATPGAPTFALTALGEVEAGRELRRSGAREGDDVWVSGTIGDGALGLMVCQRRIALDEADAAFVVDRYRLPRPRVGLGPRLVGLASAAMDVSDGLLGDLGHICAASGVCAIIEAERVPLSQAGRNALGSGAVMKSVLLTGGDDYELLFTAPPSVADRLLALNDVPLARIGRVVAGTGVKLVDGEGREMMVTNAGFRHFHGRP